MSRQLNLSTLLNVWNVEDFSSNNLHCGAPVVRQSLLNTYCFWQISRLYSVCNGNKAQGFK